ncbi:hypothetical protein N9P31_02075 [bacterium]|nr:hypothetical protein [bacterium]
MRFNTPLKTVMVLTLLTCPAVLPADPTSGVTAGVGKYKQGAIGRGISHSRIVGSSEQRAPQLAADPPAQVPDSTLLIGNLQIRTNLNMQPKLTDGSALIIIDRPAFSRGNRIPELSAETQARITRLQEIIGMDESGGSVGQFRRGMPGFIERYAAHQAELYQLQNPATNTITGRARDGTETTIYCNPGPCTMGSVLRHVRLSGLPEMMPLTLYSAVSDLMGGFDRAFEVTKRVMQTSEFRGTDANAESAYRVPAYTTILAEVSRRREAYEDNDGKVIDGVLMDVTVQYEPPETTTVTTTVDAAETEDQRKTREDRAEADRLVQAFEQRLATNLARDAQRRADNPGPVTPVVTQPTMPAAPTW